MNAMIVVTRRLLVEILAVACGVNIVSGQTPAAASVNTTPSSAYSIVQRGAYARSWQRTVVFTNAIGIPMTNAQSYSELATGICYLTNGQYADSVEEVVSVPGGAQAVQGRHQVQWALNANTPGGAVTVTTPDGRQLSSTLFGMAWYDVATGSNAAIATLQNCNGAIEATNQVVYANAFSNLTADIYYTYTKAGLSQNIALDSSPLAPASYGLSDESSILQIYTEFFTAPQPVMTAVTNGAVVDDQLLDFGDMKMGIGQALCLNGTTAPVTAGIVTKQWVQTNNRTFLIESIPYTAISNELQQLPQASTLKPGRGAVRRLAFMELAPSHPKASMKGGKPMKLAKLETGQRRLMVDYDLLSSSTNLTLQGDTTYLISGNVNITGTLTIEGGTVVKYTNSSAAQISATNIVCATGPYNPGVFSSMNDNSAGAVIAGSTGAPTNTPGVNYIDFNTLGTNSLFFRNVRFSYANFAIYGGINSSTSNSIELWDCQFINCGYALFCSPVLFSGSNPLFPLYVDNVLFSGCSDAVAGIDVGSGYVCVSAVNVTADQVGTFLSGGTNVCYATNSLFTSVTNTSGISFTDCFTNANSNGVYQTAGAGGYYLANGSGNRNAGTSNINAALLADLQGATTYPPVVLVTGLAGAAISNETTFFPQAQRDTDTPDLGYHYPPVDFAIAIIVSNATVTVLPGTVLAACGPEYGVYLCTNGIFNCAGTATSPSYFVRYNTVQEQSNTNWETTAWLASMVTPYWLDNSSAAFAFTDWSVLAQDGQICSIGAPLPVALQNCQFYAGAINVTSPSMSSSNCLFRRVNGTVADQTGGSISQSFYNNLFFEGELGVVHDNSGAFTFRDNLFDQTAVTLTLTRGGQQINFCSNNAYVTTNDGVLLPENNDVILTNEPVYQVGALGQYYYPTNLSLIHTGSQPAPAAGLYHYTVTTNNAIEGTNIVSIGFHYVAVGTNGLPLDTNGDGIPDYLEDVNGNGLVDSGEIDWLLPGDSGLTVIITQPMNNSTIP
jgi:hypothetical protein